MNLTAAQKNALQSLYMLLHLSKIRVTRTTLLEKMRQHIDFPSLASLSDTLDELKVDNLAVHLTVEQLPEIPLPALAYLRSEGGFFAPIRAIADTVEWWHNKRGWQVDSVTQFTQQWDGVILLIEPSERSGESDYTQSRKKELVNQLRQPFIALSLLICLSAWVGTYHMLPANMPLYYSLLVLEIAGVLISCLLVWYSLDTSNAFLRSICQLNSRTNCSAVLHTSASQLFSWLSWAEVGLFYFGGCLLALLFYRTNPTALYSLLFGLSIATLPYTLWSIYYQWHHARQWCVLCLAVQGILWLEFGVLLYSEPHYPWLKDIGNPVIWLFAASFLITPVLWILLKPILSKSLRANNLQQMLQSIKFDQGYLKSLVQRAGTLPDFFAEMQIPTIGKVDAQHTLVVVTNPTCSQCPRVHQEIKQLIDEFEDVRCQFIIAIRRQPGDSGFTIASLILSQHANNMLLALNEWYTTLYIKTWINKLVLTQATTEGIEQINIHQRWCELAGINATPTIFFDGIEIPGYYTVSEYRKLIKCIKESK